MTAAPATDLTPKPDATTAAHMPETMRAVVRIAPGTASTKLPAAITFFFNEISGLCSRCDLDATVLWFTNAIRGRYTVVVFAASADRHLLARHAHSGQRFGDVVG